MSGLGLLNSDSKPLPADDEAAANTRQWDLASETEYRFELDPNSSLAIKVRFRCCTTQYI